LLAYLISAMAPGSPLDALLADPNINPAEIERRRIELGLDNPVIIQYFTWLKEFFQGNLGFSFKTQRAVSDMILERLGPTAILAGCSIALSLLVSIPLGILAASKPYSKRDYVFSSLSFLMAATPNFFSGLVLIYIFAAVLRILPTGGMYDSSGSRNFAILARHLVLPTLVLSFQQIGSWIRYMRGSMLEVLQEDYIRTARAKGLQRRVVILKHGLKNALIPVVTVVGMSIPSLVGGAVVTEQIFGWPGIGSLMVQSIAARDYPVIMGITVLVAFVVLLANLLTDLVYGVLDPRIRYV
jgi:peptide/nickel transport system permease protein